LADRQNRQNFPSAKIAHQGWGGRARGNGTGSTNYFFQIGIKKFLVQTGYNIGRKESASK